VYAKCNLSLQYRVAHNEERALRGRGYQANDLEQVAEYFLCSVEELRGVDVL
jgi:hypothetical protein